MSILQSCGQNTTRSPKVHLSKSQHKRPLETTSKGLENARKKKKKKQDLVKMWWRQSRSRWKPPYPVELSTVANWAEYRLTRSQHRLCILINVGLGMDLTQLMLGYVKVGLSGQAGPLHTATEQLQTKLTSTVST